MRRRAAADKGWPVSGCEARAPSPPLDGAPADRRRQPEPVRILHLAAKGRPSQGGCPATAGRPASPQTAATGRISAKHSAPSGRRQCATARAHALISGSQVMVPQRVKTRSCCPASAGSVAGTSRTSARAKRRWPAPSSVASARRRDGGGAEIHARHRSRAALRRRDAVIARMALQVGDSKPPPISAAMIGGPACRARRDATRRRTAASRDRPALPPIGEVERAPRLAHRGAVSSTHASAASRTPRCRAAAIAARRSRRYAAVSSSSGRGRSNSGAEEAMAMIMSEP